MRITRGGQVSIPATIRKRWNTSTVTLVDHGDRIVLQPAPNDPIEAAQGALADEFQGASIEELRKRAREDDARASERHWPS